MAVPKPAPKRRYFTVAQANATLPLIRAIVRDITQLAHDLQERQERLMRVLPTRRMGQIDEAHLEELKQIRGEIERDQERMREYQHELNGLGVELKDFRTGLVDFPHRMDGREVYLCWRQGEPEVAFWHEMDAGFAGRQRLTVDAGSR